MISYEVLILFRLSNYSVNNKVQLIMSSSMGDLEDMYSRMMLADEEEGGVVVGDEEMIPAAKTYVLIGKFLTDKNVNFQAMQNVLASIWRPKEGVEIHDLGGQRYSFVFFHVLDLQKVLEGGRGRLSKAYYCTKSLRTMKIHIKYS